MNTTQTYAEAVSKTVKWWSEKSFHTPLNQNNGDNSPYGGITFSLMNAASMQAQQTVTPEKQKAFESKLTELLMNCNKYQRTLDVDYHPCEFLSEAAKFAGIDTGCFPCKSHTSINDNNRAFAKHKYGAPIVEI